MIKLVVRIPCWSAGVERRGAIGTLRHIPIALNHRTAGIQLGDKPFFAIDEIRAIASCLFLQPPVKGILPVASYYCSPVVQDYAESDFQVVDIGGRLSGNDLAGSATDGIEAQGDVAIRGKVLAPSYCQAPGRLAQLFWFPRRVVSPGLVRQARMGSRCEIVTGVAAGGGRRRDADVTPRWGAVTKISKFLYYLEFWCYMAERVGFDERQSKRLFCLPFSPCRWWYVTPVCNTRSKFNCTSGMQKIKCIRVMTL